MTPPAPDDPFAAIPVPGTDDAWMHPSLAPIVDERVAAHADLARSVDRLLVDAARDAGDDEVALRPAIALAGGAVPTRLEMATADVDLDAAVLVRLPPGTAADDAATRTAAAVADWIVRARRALETADGPLRFVAVRGLLADDGSGWEWSDGDAATLAEHVRGTEALTLLLLDRRDEDEPDLVDVRCLLGRTSKDGATDFEVRPGAFWHAHVAFGRDAATRYAAYEQAMARHFRARYDPERSYLERVDAYVALQAGGGHWLKIAKILPFRTTRLGEATLPAALGELLSSPMARAVAAATRAATVTHLLTRGALEPERAVALYRARIDRAIACWSEDARSPWDLAPLERATAPAEVFAAGRDVVQDLVRRADERTRVFLAGLADDA